MLAVVFYAKTEPTNGDEKPCNGRVQIGAGVLERSTSSPKCGYPGTNFRNMVCTPNIKEEEEMVMSCISREPAGEDAARKNKIVESCKIKL